MILLQEKKLTRKKLNYYQSDNCQDKLSKTTIDNIDFEAFLSKYQQNGFKPIIVSSNMGERILVLTFYAGVNVNESFGGQTANVHWN